MKWMAALICRKCKIKFWIENDCKDGATCPQCKGKQLVEDEIQLRQRNG